MDSKILPMEDTEKPSVAIVMVPLPAQGHLNQLLHLSRLISAYHIPIHFVTTTTHNRQVSSRVHGWDPLSSTNMNFHKIPTPPFDNPLPNPNASTKIPLQIFPCILATRKLRKPVYELVRKLSEETKRVVVIYDSCLSYVVQDICSIQNAESYCFHSISAFSLYSYFWESLGKPELPIAAEKIRETPATEECSNPLFAEFTKLVVEAPTFNSGDIFNTSRVIEGTYLDLFADEKTTGTGKNWGVGPFNPVEVPARKNHNKILEWLDNQGKDSVLFVSFGTTCSLSDEEILEIALGLEKSEQKFIWVLRDADRGDIFNGDVRKAPLPEGYEERIEGRGIVIRDWAPQLEVLAHPSTGGFISHCGWNSSMESISMGVPIGTWPMHSDQPRNATLITKVLQVGLEVMDWANRDVVVSSVTIEKAVRRLMGSAEGDEVRKRAAELGDAIRKSVMEGGTSWKEMESFISHITRQISSNVV